MVKVYFSYQLAAISFLLLAASSFQQ